MVKNMNGYDSLNPNQQKAVFSTAKYIRVIAGAGSGKTRVLTLRMVHLIQDVGIPAHRLCAITFTNKAANEMKERLNNTIGDAGSGVWLSTIHSLCVRILREDISGLNYPRNFTICDSNDQKAILKQAYKELDIDLKEFSYSYMLSYISNNKGAEISPQRALEMAGRFEEDVKKSKIYDFYETRLKKMYALDFDDLLLFTVRLFKTFPTTLKKWQKRLDYLLVDEFQDVDHIQYTLVKQLAGSDNGLFVVGDPDQTIYTWRGADVNIILDFKKQFSPVETIVLNQNYRSTKTILDGANALIKNNKYREDKELFTHNKSTDKIVHMSTNSQEEEASWISTKIKDLAQSTDYRNIAVVYRSNYLSRSIEKSLLMNGIPYVIFGGIRFYDRAEIKDTMSYLRMIVTADDLSFLRTINTPKRGLGDKAVNQINEKSIQENCSLYDAAKDYKIFSGSNQLKVRAYVELIETLKLKAETDSLEDLISDILDLSGMRQSFEDNHEQDRLENVKELISDASSFIKMFPEATLEDYLETVALYGDKNELINNAVSLMTIHASKGLEFDYVFIASMNEGVFPNERAMSEGKRGIEEERRLAYVAMTRARKRLFISDAQGFSYVLGKAQTASRFIDEIDSDAIEHHRISSYGQVIKATPKEELQAYLRGQETTISSQTSKKTKYKKGDVIIHTSFGEGIIISIDDGFASVAFNHPFGMKKLVLSHPSIMKKEKSYGA